MRHNSPTAPARTRAIPAPLRIAATFTLVAVTARYLPAEDSIDRKGSNAPLRGDVAEVSPIEVLLKARSTKREYRVPANEIERVRWEAEKPQLTQVRNEERNGHFDKAIAGYEAALAEAPLSALNLRTDLEFFVARTSASKALAEEDHLDAAIARLEKFKVEHPSSFRYFDALRLLTRLYMAKPDVAKAGATLKLMSEAPWTDYKMEAQLLQARVDLTRGDMAAALKSLDEVVATKPSTPAETSRRYEAMLTKADCFQKQGKFTEATGVLSQILNEAAEEDTKTLAGTCVRLGDCYQAGGQLKEAILAYLRVDILFPKEKSQHAEALYHLSRLFAQDGKPEKGADAAARLQQIYPRSPWTAKLAVVPK